MDTVNRQRRISYFQRLGEAAVRADLDSGAHRFIGRDAEAVLTARQWLVEQEDLRRIRERRERREQIVKWCASAALLAFAATFFRI